MIAALLLLAAAAQAPASPRSAAAHAGGATRCDACHSASGWKPVTFDHSKTGFPLDGRHRDASCRACHSSPDFRDPLPTSCAACHRDVHTSTFGNRCVSCHDATSWKAAFGPDAHNRTNFPLTGRHAAIPCEECHLDRRDRAFTRATRECFECHQADYARTAGTSLDHMKAGFGTDCKGCHFPTSFKGARFAAHDACFQISSGPHAGIGCAGCHTSVTSTVPTGTCTTGTADCMRCHTCSKVTPKHATVGGFQCKDRKCYECHQFTATGATLRTRKAFGR